MKRLWHIMVSTKLKGQLKAWFIRTFYKSVKLNIESKPALFDVVRITGQDLEKEFLYVGKGVFKQQKSFIKKGGYPKLKISGNFNLHELLL